jgi:hypothetical protein
MFREVATVGDETDGSISVASNGDGKYELSVYPGGREMILVFDDVEVHDRTLALYKTSGSRRTQVTALERSDLGDVEDILVSITQSTGGTVRTICDECGIDLHHDEGHEFGHGSYCDIHARDYRYQGTVGER